MCKIGSEAAELIDNVCLNVSRLVGLKNGLLVEVAENTVGVIEASFYEKSGGRIGVVDHVGHFEQRLGAVFVGGCHLAEVGDEVFEELAPGYRMSVS